jgi:hypothetical protein
MARWKLASPHYINVPGTEWEYQETDRKTGRPIRKKFQVPTLLDPNDPTCWTNRWGNNDNAEGEIVVCHEGKGLDSDTVFIGDPSPDMIPVDDEAKAISASFEKLWNHRPEEAQPNSFSQSMIDRFEMQMAESKQAQPLEGVEQLLGAMTKMMDQNAQLIAALGNKAIERRP